MIRPFTCVCMLLAGGAGLYLYQTKHQSQMLDREIAHTMKQTEVARARAGVLQAEYALLNDPSRLADLAAGHLTSLKTTMPTQFTTWAEFEKHLPAVGAPAVEAPPLEPEAPSAKLPDPVPDAKPEAAHPLVASVARPTQPAPAPRPAPAQAAQPAPHPADPPSPAAPQPSASAHPPAPPHPVAVSAHPAPPPPRAVAAYVPPSGSTAEAVARIARGGPVDPATPAVASALGMARSMMAPPPVTPASAATIWQPSTASR